MTTTAEGSAQMYPDAAEGASGASVEARQRALESATRVHGRARCGPGYPARGRSPLLGAGE